MNKTDNGSGPSLRLQDKKNLAWIALFVFLGSLTCYSVYCRQFIVVNQDVEIYMEVARNLLEGKGFTTNYRAPFEIPFLPEQGGVLSKMNLRSLGHPLWLVPPMYFFANSEFAVLIYSTFFHLLTLVPLFLIARHIFDRRTALVACLLFVGSTHLAVIGLQGFTNVPFVLIVMWALYFVFVREHQPYASVIVAALLIGIGAYFREDVSYLKLIFLGYLIATSSGRQRWARPIIFWAIVYLATYPKLLYFQHFFGINSTLPAPHLSYTFLNELSDYPNWIAQSHFVLPEFQEIIQKYWFELILRAFSYFKTSLAFLFSQYAVIVVMGAIGALESLSNPRKRQYAIFAWLAMLGLLAQHTLSVPLPRYYHTPAIYLLPVAAWGLVSLYDRYANKNPVARRMTIGVIAVLIAAAVLAILPPCFNKQQMKYNRRERDYFLKVMNLVQSAVPEDAWIVTDKVVDIAYYARRSSILLPVKKDMLDELVRDYHLPEDYYVMLGNFYYHRSHLYDPDFKKAVDQGLPIKGKPVVFMLNRKSYPIILFGPEKSKKKF